MLANFSPANLTAYVAIVNPALASHVLNNIKICFLKVRRADADLHAYVADALEIFCTVITKIKCTTVIDCFILFPIEPEHEINLRGVPTELVPGYSGTYDICDQRRLRRACAFAQSHKGLAAHYHKV